MKKFTRKSSGIGREGYSSTEVKQKERDESKSASNSSLGIEVLWKQASDAH